MSFSDSDSEEDIEGLMGLLDSVEPVQMNISAKKTRDDYPNTTRTLHFSLNENGKVNYRDAVVLKEPPTLIISPAQRAATHLKISIFLNYDIGLTSATTVDAPKLYNDVQRSMSMEISKKFNVQKNEVMIPISALDDNGAVEFAKRSMSLSRGFRQVTRARWPRFIFVVTSYGENPSVSVSDDFEVRSKEQSNKVRAGQGESVPKRKRRTPETEARAQKLRKIQTEIIAIRQMIDSEEKKSIDYTSRLDFVKEVSASSAMGQNIRQFLNYNKR